MASVEKLKLRRMIVSGFKALEDFDLRFPDGLILLIGANGSGKSSILQALTFVKYFAKGQTKQFFNDRHWNIAAVRGKVSSSRGSPQFSVKLLLETSKGCEIAWGFSWGYNTTETTSESVWVRRTSDAEPVHVLSYNRMTRTINAGNSTIKGLTPEGTLLATFDPEFLNKDYTRELESLKRWGPGVFSLELLSPSSMRAGARGIHTDIGFKGERLGGFLASLSPEAKARVVKRLQRFYPLEGLETTRKRAGWVDLQISESFENIGPVNAAHMSDGFMRLLGLATIPEFSDEASLILLDEVEDGIDPHILPKFINSIAKESPAQLMITSHSPLLVNFFEPKQICFIARSRDGRSLSAGFDEISDATNGLEYMGAGEVWANTSSEKITSWVRAASKHNNEKIQTTRKFVRDAAELKIISPKNRVKKFMDGES